MITPQTDIILLKSPLELTDANQITFSNATAQFNYFNSLPKLEVDGATYQRKDNTIRFPASYDTVLTYNYVMYRNEAYSNKWFYAFIDKMDYINDNLTAVSIKEDVFQTWQFDFQYTATFVEREHVNDDTIGANTYPEGLEIGEYVNNGNPTEAVFAQPVGVNQYRIIASVSDISILTLPEGFENIPVYGGVPSGLTYIVLRTISDIDTFVQLFEGQQKGDAINGFFLVPYNSIDDNSITWNGNFGYLGALNQFKEIATITLNRPTSINGYTPINKKLLCYPYSCAILSNYVGGDVETRWEDFTGGVASLKAYCTINPGCSIRCVPQNYKGLIDNYNEGFSGAKLPVCGWNSDTYTNWLTQNGVNIIWQDTRNALSLAASIPTAFANPLVGAGAIAGSLNQIASNLNERQQMKAVPDQAKGNVNGSDVNYAKGKLGMAIIPMSIKAEYARIVDNFFSMFGYKINRVKTPNITGRANWNYVKTNSCYVGGNIPQDSLNEFKNMLDRGITFWHNPTTFMDYSQANNIV